MCSTGTVHYYFLTFLRLKRIPVKKERDLDVAQVNVLPITWVTDAFMAYLNPQKPTSRGIAEDNHNKEPCERSYPKTRTKVSGSGG